MADNKNNPRNPNSPLFQRLTRLFSGPIVNYRAQQVRNNRKYSVDKYASKFRSVGGQSFKRKSYNPYESISTAMMNNYNRAERYADFDQMEFMPELASALDIYADEVTTHSEFHKSLIIDCQNEEIKDILETLFHKVLNVDSNLFGWVRSMCKYGDFFGYLDIDEEIGIKSFIGLPVSEIERMEGTDQSNPNYVQYQWNTGGLTFENWQLAHFRVLGNDKYTPYGTSVLDPGRRIWRQLTLLEDAMIAYRVVRSPQRKQFKIDVGGIPPEEVEQYMQKIITMMKRHQVVDDKSGRVDLRYNPLSIEEDYYIPTRNGQSSVDISTVQGDTWGTAIEDIKYLQNKLFAAIKIPMSYLIRGGDGATEEQASLAQKDIRFARTIQRIQRAVVAELDKMATIHLYTLGYRGNDLISFDLKLHNPSRVSMLQEMEMMNQKLDAASKARGDVYSNRWIAKNILGLSEEELIRNTREKFYDKQIETALAKIATEQGEGLAAETLTGGGFGGVGDIGLGGEADLGAAPAEPETGLGEVEPGAPAVEAPEPETPAPEPEAAGGEDVLLATPEGGGKRSNDKPAAIYTEFADGSYTGPKDKGKRYKKVESDRRRNAKRRESWGTSGPRKPRNVFASMAGGAFIKENKSNYSEEFENRMSSLNEEMDRILSEDL